MRADWKFHQVWIMIEKSLMKWAPGWKDIDEGRSIFQQSIVVITLLWYQDLSCKDGLYIATGTRGPPLGYLTRKGIPITCIKVKQSHTRLIFMIGIPIPGKRVFTLQSAQIDLSYQHGNFYCGRKMVLTLCAKDTHNMLPVHILPQQLFRNLPSRKTRALIQYKDVILPV